MTVQELITELQKIEDKDTEVYILNTEFEYLVRVVSVDEGKSDVGNICYIIEPF